MTTGMTKPGSPDSVPDAEPGGAVLLLPLALPFLRAVGDPPTPREAMLSWSDRNPQLSRPVKFHDGVKGGMKSKFKQPTVCLEIHMELFPMEPLAKFSSLQLLDAINGWGLTSKTAFPEE